MKGTKKRVYFKSQFHNTKSYILLPCWADIICFTDLEIEFPHFAKRLGKRLCGISDCNCHISYIGQ